MASAWACPRRSPRRIRRGPIEAQASPGSFPHPSRSPRRIRRGPIEAFSDFFRGRARTWGGSPRRIRRGPIEACTTRAPCRSAPSRSPRRIRRGPIEAASPTVRRWSYTLVLHGEFAVAPLKRGSSAARARRRASRSPRRIRRGPIEAQGARATHSSITCVLHGEFAVAPLKRHRLEGRQPLGDPVLHGEFAVAPLKLLLPVLLSRRNHCSPRRIRRGPIEAACTPRRAPGTFAFSTANSPWPH